MIQKWIQHINEGNQLLLKLKNKIYKHMTSISKNACIDKLDDIVNKYNNTYNSTIKMKPIDVKNNTYIGFDKKAIIKILNLTLKRLGGGQINPPPPPL